MAPKEEARGCCSAIMIGLFMSLMLMLFVCSAFALQTSISLSHNHEMMLLDLALDTSVCHSLPVWYILYFCCGFAFFLASLPLGSAVSFPSKKLWYFICLIILDLLALLAGCALLVNVSFLQVLIQRLPDELTPGLQKLLQEQNYYVTPLTHPTVSPAEFTAIGKYMNYVQSKHSCCGVYGNKGFDYEEADFQGKYNLTLPFSCCTLKPDNNNADWLQVGASDILSFEKCSLKMSGFFHSLGCSMPLQAALEETLMKQVDSALVIGGIAVVTAAFLIVKIIAKCRKSWTHSRSSHRVSVPKRSKSPGLTRRPFSKYSSL